MTHAALLLLSIFIALLLFWLLFIAVVMFSKKPQTSIRISAKTYLCIYASQSGQAAGLAAQTAQQLQLAGEDAACISIKELKAAQLEQAHRTLWFVSTYGEGDAPDTAQAFRQIQAQQLDLSHQSFAVLALGDRRYTHFCAFGQSLQQWLEQQQASPYFDMATVDQMAASDLQHWQTQLSQTVDHVLTIVPAEKHWQEIQLQTRELLNAGSLGAPLHHLRFSAPAGLSWQSGDILEIQCANSDAALEEFVQQHCTAETDRELLRYKNLQQLSGQQLRSPVSEWLETLEMLPLREYSIASIPSQQTLDLVVRLAQSEQGTGLGSGLLSQGLKIGQRLPASIRSNPGFRLNQGDHPAVFIGNGSGIAGILAHLAQREASGCKKNWLIYGERQQQFDAVFNARLHMLQQNKALPMLDLAYSRDEGAMKYVQHALLAKADQLKALLEQGASIYVCGSLKGMAQGVEQALIEIIGQDSLNELKAKQRYKRDVY